MAVMPSSFELKARYPTLQVTEHPTSYELRARVPGFGPEEVEAAFAAGLAKLAAKGIDAGRVEASVQDGTLTLQVPKAPGATGRQFRPGAISPPTTNSTVGYS